jgi:hypothetical protein|tara:strand:+ start:52 stop:492 length:441 start_codon:yes stop_codon:yes gene_type:complete
MERENVGFLNANQEEPEAFPSLEEEGAGWNLEDDPEDDTSQPLGLTARSGGLSREQRMSHSNRMQELAERHRGENSLNLRPDITGPASTARGLARQRTQQPLIHSNQGNENFGFNYPPEMGTGRPPIMARKAFGHAMEMLKSRYFG